MYEVFGKGVDKNNPECYIVLSPTGGLIETYKVNPLIPTSTTFAKSKAQAHADQLNKAWKRMVA